MGQLGVNNNDPESAKIESQKNWIRLDDVKPVSEAVSNKCAFIYFVLWFGYSASGMVIIIIREMLRQECFSSPFIVTWWIAHFLFITINTFIELRSFLSRQYRASSGEIAWDINYCEIVMVFWGLCGIVGYLLTQPHLNTTCSSISWIGSLVWSIISISVVVIKMAKKLCS
ncbi:uncharacterized protein LOC120332914 [Styela clava]